MQDVECILIVKKVVQNEIGVEKETEEETPIPIIKVEDIYATEYYEANQSGYKPTLRLKISALNYNGAKELKYMEGTYSIIRMATPHPDELVLICERKLKDV